MLRSLLIKLSMLGVTLGALVWIGMMTPMQQVMPPARQVAAVSVPATVPSVSPSVPVAPVPEVKPEPPAVIDAPVAPVKSAPVEQPVQARAQTRQSEARRVDLNQASVTDLENLPGIGPKLAQRVVDHRASRGPFHKVEELQHVKGIGRKKFDRLRPFVLVTNTKVPSRH